jgi:hypothetical protein
LSRFGRIGLVVLLVLGAASPSLAASVTAGGLRVEFAAPPGWIAGARPPPSLLALYKPKSAGTFPHLAVTEGEAGTAAGALEHLRAALPRFLGEQGIEGPQVLLAPRTARGPDRVELAYAGTLGEVACDWFQVVVPSKGAGVIFTFALPRGTLPHWRGAIDDFARSLQVVP